MSLKELSFQHEYRSDKTNLIDDFYTPCLKTATQYCRAVAYFTSNGLQKIVDGLPTFIQNGGHISLVTGPKLMDDDIQAIKSGYEARKEGLSTKHDSNFVDVSHDRLLLLTWLITHEYFDIKIALPSDINPSYPHGVYHEKIGVFLDSDNDAVAFSGSSNETVGGLLSNFESIDVHWSWNDTQERVQQKINNFHRLWDNTTDRLKVMDFQDAYNEDFLIRQTVYETEEDSTDERQDIVESSASYLPDGILLRDYQVEAIDAWFENDCKGIWEMATGTGKTITALSALARLREEKKRLFVLIVCPYQHLVDQWNEVVLLFGYKPILAYRNSSLWVDRFNSALVRFNWCISDTVCIVTTQSTFITDNMQKLLINIKHQAVIVVDEVHHLGSERSLKVLTDDFDWRLGLSATPNRWFDEAGTDALKAYFGDTVFEFTLDNAIKMGYLCPYYYHPHLIELTECEFEEYQQLSSRISKLHHSIESKEISETLQRLLIKRASLLNRAENKLVMLTELLNEKVDSLHHTLFYCAPGRITSVYKLLTDLGMRIAKFTAEESISTRQQLLQMFASGTLQALLAMKCLDEGVDIPNTQTAYILASSTNPREFIQRRGRILRKSPGKENAVIHDFIVTPPKECQQIITKSFPTERKIISRELHRFNEFADASLNKIEARDTIWEFAKNYNLLGELIQS